MRGSNTNFLAASLGKPKLSAVMSLLFVGLSVPVLILILIFTYYKNSAEIISIRDREVAQTRQVSVESSQEFINPIVGTLRLLAGMAAADPGLFRTKESRELLYRALTSSEQIDAVYASFEDGYHASSRGSMTIADARTLAYPRRRLGIPAISMLFLPAKIGGAIARFLTHGPASSANTPSGQNSTSAPYPNTRRQKRPDRWPSPDPGSTRIPAIPSYP